MATSAAEIFAPVAGVVTDSGTHRLFLNRAATWVLSGLLAGILIYAAISRYSMSTRNVLPKNSFSIGAMISLLADFNLFEKEALTIRKPIPSPSIVKMGWSTGRHEGKRIFTIRMMDDEMHMVEEHDTSTSIPCVRSLVLQGLRE